MKNKKILIPIIILLIILILGHQAIIDFVTIDDSYVQQNITKSAEHIVLFEEYRMQFRAPINQSELIQVYPNEQALQDIFLSKDLETVQIVIISNETVNGQYILVSHALAVDIPLILEKKIGTKPEVKAQGVNSTEDAFILASSTEPVIMLLHPSMSNRTAITIEENVIFLEGESFELVENDYFDLDRAAGKLMLTLMEEYQTIEQ